MGKKSSANSKTIVLTAAQEQTRIHDEFADNIKRYLDYHDGEFFLLRMQGYSVHEIGMHDEVKKFLDDLVKKDINYRRADKQMNVVYDQDGERASLKLNDNIQVGIFNVLPQMIDPVTSLEKYASSDRATIFASPKMRMKIIPNGQDYPKVLLTTGAITKPNYRSNRQGQMAWRDHKYGAIVVEIDGNKRYHFRHIEAVASTGAFSDLGWNYSKEGRKRIPTKALVLGDWHVGDTSEEVRDASFRLIRELKPEEVFLHDFFNGHSINHHERDNIMERIRTYEEGRADFEQEVIQAYEELQVISDKIGSNAVAYVVPSNHHDFIMKYLKNSKWVAQDIMNYRFSQKVITKLLDEKEDVDPLYAALEVVSDGKLPENIRFLSRTEDKKVKGFQLSKHGDQGGNGAKGSPKSIENSYGKSVSGHTHVPQRLRDTFIAGTSTDLRLRYNTGDSGWLQSHVAIYDDGKAQHINIIDGKYKP